MLMYLDHSQNWLVYDHGLLIFLILAFFYLVKWVKFGGSGNFLKNLVRKLCMLMYLEHLQNWLDYGCSLLIFLILALFWFSETGQIWGCQPFSGQHIEGMAWNFACRCILTTFRSVYGDGLLTFPILALFWLRKIGQIWGFWSCSVDFPHYGAPLTETGHIWGFWALSGEGAGVNVEGERKHISDALRRILSSFFYWVSSKLGQVINQRWKTCTQS